MTITVKFCSRLVLDWVSRCMRFRAVCGRCYVASRRLPVYECPCFGLTEGVLHRGLTARFFPMTSSLKTPPYFRSTVPPYLEKDYACTR